MMIEPHHPSSTLAPSIGSCVVVTPTVDDAVEPVPEELGEALDQHRASVEHASSTYHAVTSVQRSAEPATLALLIVEPDRCARSDELALAVMTHAPDVAVWRYDPRSDAPVAPYVPHRPGVVPEPLVPEPDAEGPPLALASERTPSLRVVGTPMERDPAPEPPLVTGEELALLLGSDPTDRHAGDAGHDS